MSGRTARLNPEGLVASTLLALLATAGVFYVNIMSALVDGLVTGLGFSTAQSGNVAAANVYGAACGALVAVFIVTHIRWRTVALVLLMGLIAIDVGWMSVPDGKVLTTVRFFHGLV